METRNRQSSSLNCVRLVKYQDVDIAMITWFRQHLEKTEFRIDGIMLHRKANYFAREFAKDAEITQSWVDRWKKLE